MNIVKGSIRAVAEADLVVADGRIVKNRWAPASTEDAPHERSEQDWWRQLLLRMGIDHGSARVLGAYLADPLTRNRLRMLLSEGKA